MSETPEQTAALAAALAAFQAELPEVKKNRSADVKNKEGKYLYSYTYADLADVSAAALPVLGKHGLAFAAFPGHQDGKFGLRYYLLHSGGGSIEGFFAIDDGGGMQLVGGRITYARRYCLCAVTGITADEDVDAKEEGPSRTVRRQQPGNSARQPESTAQRARPHTQTSPPAKAATTPPAAGPASPSGAGGDLPPLPRETRTAAEYVAGKLAALGVDTDAGRLRSAGRLSGRTFGKWDDMTPSDATGIMRSLRDCRTPEDLDGMLAELAMQEVPSA